MHLTFWLISVGCSRVHEDFMWLSSDEAVVSVSTSGLLRTNNPGRAVIKVVSVLDSFNYDEVYPFWTILLFVTCLSKIFLLKLLIFSFLESYFCYQWFCRGNLYVSICVYMHHGQKYLLVSIIFDHVSGSTILFVMDAFSMDTLYAWKRWWHLAHFLLIILSSLSHMCCEGMITQPIVEKYTVTFQVWAII